ncbi:carbohydrate esterase family 4 protein [Crucibulum laeve]|uniref:Carbohydrate esterase family 4 protein n=1 Tax=Crucibulum laeve TaxID=68775 RepID=A0A5C3LDP9_9AGAR|nr:carbohydrate esterase family 4 protein [Crucibulum laeve]
MLLFYILAFSLLIITSTFALPHNLEERQQRAQVITRCTVPNTEALTFDDGPCKYIYDVIKALKDSNATGTFFFRGCIYGQEDAKRVKYAYEQKQQIASHTWAHKNLTTLSADQKAFERITGAVPAFMRPPYGNYNTRVLDVAGIRKQTVVTWDFDSGDSTGASVTKQKSLYDAVVKKHPSTILSLAHEVHASSVYEVLPYAIKKLRGAGYKLVSVSEYLGKPAHQRVGKPSTRTMIIMALLTPDPNGHFTHYKILGIGMRVYFFIDWIKYHYELGVLSAICSFCIPST